MKQACYTKETAIMHAKREMQICMVHLSRGEYIKASWHRGAAMVYEDMLIDVFDYYLYDEDDYYSEQVDRYTNWGCQ